MLNQAALEKHDTELLRFRPIMQLQSKSNKTASNLWNVASEMFRSK
jgi:hypothetical protein